VGGNSLCVSKEAKPAKIVSLIEKILRAPPKRKRNFCGLCLPPSGGSEPLTGFSRTDPSAEALAQTGSAATFHQSRILDRISSSGTIQSHNKYLGYYARTERCRIEICATPRGLLAI